MNWGIEGIAETNSQSIWTNCFVMKQFNFKVAIIFSLVWLGRSSVFLFLKIRFSKYVLRIEISQLKMFQNSENPSAFEFPCMFVTWFWEISVMMIPWPHCTIIHTPWRRPRGKYWTVYFIFLFTEHTLMIKPPKIMIFFCLVHGQCRSLFLACLWNCYRR